MYGGEFKGISGNTEGACACTKLGFVPPDIITKRILRNLSSFLKYTILGKIVLLCGLTRQPTDLCWDYPAHNTQD